jgi:hypothetical protein
VLMWLCGHKGFVYYIVVRFVVLVWVSDFDLKFFFRAVITGILDRKVVDSELLVVSSLLYRLSLRFIHESLKLQSHELEETYSSISLETTSS